MRLFGCGSVRGRRRFSGEVSAMSGHVGLREDARAGHLLAQRIARLFAAAQRSASQVLAPDKALTRKD